ncbi:HBR378Cp [Eremothecium sinecaudum]|uniref:HBR378Cp n=1 Tax=Eremothecium sinecaudum TaxID=45286 RepID=A0A120K1D5_9SACH|nr:HBR378Cp [Eremothecium sinecaudum]AMD19279.1 HBR378Cp [Eremothecium sinecaudum]
MSSKRKSPRSAGRRIKALDLLDKHIHQRSSQKKLIQPQSGSLGALTLNRAPTESIFERSPTPRRDEGRRLPTTSSSSKPLDIAPPLTAEPLPLSASSPIRKTVAFSDKLESPAVCAPISSSPIVPSSKHRPPSKSILKTSPTKNLTLEDAKELQAQPSHAVLDHSANTAITIDPFSLQYWAVGEVHGLIDPNNLAEYKRILEGAIHLLKGQGGSNRLFEIYATLNNIFPPALSSDPNDIGCNKGSIIIDHLDQLIQVSYVHLREVQESLLQEVKKDPFTSRLYVQIVRLFNTLFSNYRIIRCLENKQNLRATCQSVLNLSVACLRHANTNKVMANAQLTFLREEKFSQHYFTDSMIEPFIIALTELKEISSTNLICEKLLLLKHYLARYPKVMLGLLDTWLPGEVFARILMEEENYSNKVIVNAVSVLLDLLKTSITVQQVDLDKIIESSAGELMSVKFIGKLNSEERAIFNSTKIGNLLIERIQVLIVKRAEYKLAMDLWLSMVGLLYGSPSSLKKLATDTGKSWILPNFLCYTEDNDVAKKLSLKSWRIIIYLIIVNVQLDDPNANELTRLILQPLKAIFESQDQSQSAVDGAIYLLTDILFMLFCDNTSSMRFHYFYKHILSPLLEDYVPNHSSALITNHIQIVVIRLLTKPEKHGRQPRKSFNPMRVLASVGITHSDLLPVSFNIINTHWDDILKLVIEIMSYKNADAELNVQLFVLQLASIPISCVTNEHCTTCNNLAQRLLRDYGKEPADPQNLESTRKTLLTALFKAFGMLMLKEEDNSSNFFNLIELLGKSESDQLYWLKCVLEMTKNIIPDVFVMERFLSLKNNSIDVYVGNLIGSKLLSATIQPNVLSSFINIVNKIPTVEAIDNVLDFCTKVRSNKVELLKALHFLNWEEKHSIYFITKYTQKFTNGLIYDDMVEILKPALFNQPKMFAELSGLLISSNHTKLVKEIIESHPEFLKSLNAINLLTLPKILSEKALISLLSKLDGLDSESQYKLLEYVIENKQVQVIRQSSETILAFINGGFASGDMNTSPLLNRLLDITYENEDWELLGRIIPITIESESFERVSKMLEGNEEVMIEHFDIYTIVSILKKHESSQQLFDVIIRKFLETKSPSSSLQLIRELIGMNKLQLFENRYIDLLTFIFDPNDVFTEQDRLDSMELFPVIANYLIAQPKKVISNAMREVSKLIPLHGREYVFQLLARIVLHPKFKVKGYSSLISQIRRWKEGTATPKKRPKMFKFISPTKSTLTEQINKGIPDPIPLPDVKIADVSKLSYPPDCVDAENKAAIENKDVVFDGNEAVGVSSPHKSNNNHLAASEDVNDDVSTQVCDENETEQESNEELVAAPEEESENEQEQEQEQNIENTQFLNSSPTRNINNECKLSLGHETDNISDLPTLRDTPNQSPVLKAVDNDISQIQDSKEGVEGRTVQARILNDNIEAGNLASNFQGTSSPVKTNKITSEEKVVCLPEGNLIDNVQGSEDGLSDDARQEHNSSPPQEENNNLPAANTVEAKFNSEPTIKLESERPWQSFIAHETELSSENEDVVISNIDKSLDRTSVDSPVQKQPIEHERIQEKRCENEETMREQVSQAEDNDDADVSVVAPLRIPIFKSNRVFYPHLENSKSHPVRNIVSAGDEPKSMISLKRTRSENDENDEYNHQDMGLQTVDGNALRAKFPTKKIRRAVNKLRNLKESDLQAIGEQEKQNLRIELLQFILQLERL